MVSLELTMWGWSVYLKRQKFGEPVSSTGQSWWQGHVTCCVASLPLPEGRKEKSNSDPRQSLLQLEGNLQKVATVSAIADEAKVDQCLLEQYDEQLSGFKLELSNMLRCVLSMDSDDSRLSDNEARILNAIFNVCLKIRWLLHTPVPVVHWEGVKLHKIDVPTFEGNIMAKVLGPVGNFNSFENSAN